MKLQSPLLEDWMRQYYFRTDVDIGSSGVKEYTFAEVRALADISMNELDTTLLCDSPTTGSLGLKEAIAHRWGGGDPEMVMVAHGASEAIYLGLTATIAANDDVIVMDPSYHSHTSVVRQIGGRVIPWTLQESEQFSPNLDILADLVTSRTTAIVVNFPHNPTGVTLSQQEQTRLVEIARDASAYLFWDASFGDLTYGSPPLPDPTLQYHKAVSVGTLSKSFGLPGLRFGWCIAQPDVIAAAVGMKDVMTICLSPLIELIARKVISRSETFLQPRLGQARENLAELARWASTHSDLMDLSVPAGGVTAFPRVGTGRDTDDLCARMARKHRVLLVPGRAFGHPARVRLGFGCDAGDIAIGLRRLHDELATC